jgi:adenylate cyclase
MLLSGRNLFILRNYLYEIPYWVFILIAYVLVRFGGSQSTDLNVLIFYDKPTIGLLLVYAIIIGTIFGTILTTGRLFFWSNMCKKISIGKSILVQTVLSTSIFILLIFTILTIHEISLGNTVELAMLTNFLTDQYSLTTLLILTGLVIYAKIQFNLLLEADKKLGINVLKNLLLGKYYEPAQEERIFMFLDMKDSTKTAEILGHIRYSRYLQDIFKLLTDIVIDLKAEIYQFVGDEVVITWKSDIGYHNNNALHFFHNFQELLQENWDYFNTNYGVNPIFKAGLHRGVVSVAEVGEINTQIAYHGDVVNTTSRIQELCNVYETNLLVSDMFMSGMEIPPANFKENAAEINLRGRVQPITIYNLEMAASK